MSQTTPTEPEDNKITQEIFIKGQKFMLDIELGEVTLTLRDPRPGTGPVEPTDPVDPTEPTEPVEPVIVDPFWGEIKTGSKWSKDPGKAETWKIVNMKNNPELFKIVDTKGLNIIADLETEEMAKALVEYFKTHAFPPKDDSTDPTTPGGGPPDGGGGGTPSTATKDKDGNVMIYAAKEGGQVVTFADTYQKESDHNSGPRSSRYSKVMYNTNSGELTSQAIIELTDNGEQFAPKIYSGRHTGGGDDPETLQGICYAVGYNQNGTLHFAKEWPRHPTTPKFYDAIEYVNPKWKHLGGNVKGKLVGMKVIYFPIQGGTRIEWWFDVKGLQTGKIENDWQFMAYVEDKGQLVGPPITENSSIKHGDDPLGHYYRIDMKSKPVEFLACAQHELALPPKKLVQVVPPTPAA